MLEAVFLKRVKTAMIEYSFAKEEYPRSNKNVKCT